MAVSSNIAIEGTKGGPERYELFMKYGQPPSTKNYDQKSVLTASDSYVGDVLYRYNYLFLIMHPTWVHYPKENTHIARLQKRAF